LGKLSFPIDGLNIFFLPILSSKSPNNISLCYLGNMWNARSNSSWNLSFVSSVISSVGASILTTMLSHQRPLSIMYDILPLTNSTLFTADMILLHMKKLLPHLWFSFPFPYKNVYLPAGSVPLRSHLTSCTPTNSNLYFVLLLQLLSVTLAYIDSLRSVY
jgi:hypothetical protein